MQKLLTIFVVALALFFVSCEKEIGAPKACFTFSTETPKPGDSVYVFNCSENYQIWTWYLPGGVTSSARHSYFVAPAQGTYPVALFVGNYGLKDTTTLVRSITVN